MVARLAAVGDDLVAVQTPRTLAEAAARREREKKARLAAELQLQVRALSLGSLPLFPGTRGCGSCARVRRLSELVRCLRVEPGSRFGRRPFVDKLSNRKKRWSSPLFARKPRG